MIDSLNQQYAIELAKERGEALIFMYVSHVRFLERVSRAVLVDMAHELDEMGEFLLAMAQDRAENAGISAETIVCHGGFRENLKDAIQKRDVTTVCLGSARGRTGVTTEDFQGMMSSFLGELGVELIILNDGTPVNVSSS